jgi:hypothetical protein
MKKVDAASKGISTIGFRVVKLSLNPSNPLSKASKIITWNRKIGKVLLLIAWTTRRAKVSLAPGQSGLDFSRIKNNAADPTMVFTVRYPKK